MRSGVAIGRSAAWFRSALRGALELMRPLDLLRPPTLSCPSHRLYVSFDPRFTRPVTTQVSLLCSMLVDMTPNHPDSTVEASDKIADDSCHERQGLVQRGNCPLEVLDITALPDQMRVWMERYLTFAVTDVRSPVSQAGL